MRNLKDLGIGVIIGSRKPMKVLVDEEDPKGYHEFIHIGEKSDTERLVGKINEDAVRNFYTPRGDEKRIGHGHYL